MLIREIKKINEPSSSESNGKKKDGGAFNRKNMKKDVYLSVRYFVCLSVCLCIFNFFVN